MMKYEKPNMEVLLLEYREVVTTSLTYQEYERTDTGSWNEWVSGN